MATTILSELKLRREAKQWQDKADAAEDEYRSKRDALKKQADDNLDHALQALEAKEEREELFTINWQVM